LKSGKAGSVEKTAASEILKATAERRLTVEVVRTKHVLGEPFVAVVEQSLDTTDDAVRLARTALDGLARSPATALDDAARVSELAIDDGGRVAGKVAKAGTRTKTGRFLGKALVPLGIVIDGSCRVKDAKAVEEQFSSGQITQQTREIDHAKNGAGFVGGWAVLWPARKSVGRRAGPSAQRWRQGRAQSSGQPLAEPQAASLAILPVRPPPRKRPNGQSAKSTKAPPHCKARGTAHSAVEQGGRDPQDRTCSILGLDQHRCGSTFLATRRFFGHFCLVSLDQILDSQGIGLVMAVAGERIGAAGGLNQDVGPDQAGVDMDRSHLA
jgi:hypothetical protein